VTDTLAIILGGGQGTRLFPLTATRSKPAVPIGGKYRLIDIPISGCVHASIRRIFVLTQFNSASLNRHISQTYRLDRFSGGFVEILAAEQTPDNPNWYQGTADAVRQAARHFTQHQADYDLVLAGDHLYRMDYAALVDAHRRSGADITIAAQPVDVETATQMGIFRFDRDGTISAFEEKPRAPRLAEIGRSIPEGSTFAAHRDDTPFMASMGIYVFSRRVLVEMLEREPGHDFGRELIPNALGKYRVKPYLYDGYWADVGTIESFYDANVVLGQPGAPFRFWDPLRPIYTHLRDLPGSRLRGCQIADSLVADGCDIGKATIGDSVVGIRTRVQDGARLDHAVVLGADYYEGAAPPGVPRLGIGRDVVLHRVVLDKNARIGDGARLINEQGVDYADGDGYYIRGGIIVVAKGGVIRPGTVV
jgi:glucose-1-phosphate adenylyltransferase